MRGVGALFPLVRKQYCMKKNVAKSGRLLLMNIVGMLVAVVAICFFVLLGIDSYTLHGQVVDVPSVCGLSIDQAAEQLRGQGLDFEIAEYKYSKSVAADVVIDQQPVAGAKVKDGRKIQLVLNSGSEPLVALPHIVDNCSLREAEARLRAAGFKLAERQKINGEVDWVYHVLKGEDTLHNGDKVPAGATLTLCIGNGDEAVDDSEPIMEESWFE